MFILVLLIILYYIIEKKATPGIEPRTVERNLPVHYNNYTKGPCLWVYNINILIHGECFPNKSMTIGSHLDHHHITTATTHHRPHASTPTTPTPATPATPATTTTHQHVTNVAQRSTNVAPTWHHDERRETGRQ